jgi:hypothetical protein
MQSSSIRKNAREHFVLLCVVRSLSAATGPPRFAAADFKGFSSFEIEISHLFGILLETTAPLARVFSACLEASPVVSLWFLARFLL